MTAEEKLKSVEDQLTLYDRGELEVLRCPYCQGINQDGAVFCCMKFGAALEAVMDRRESQEAIDQIARLSDKIQSN